MDFVYRGSGAQVSFGKNAGARLVKCMDELGSRHALLLSTPHQKAEAARIAQSLGGRLAGHFAGAEMHTPIHVTEEALRYASDIVADCVVAFGGGSTTGLGKAISYRTGLPQIVIPTTYAGSEATPILGQTENGIKTTLRSEKLLPAMVIYDPDLTLGLPVAMSVTSGLNAIAHAAEGLYAPDANPLSSMMAVEGMRRFHAALPVIVKTPSDLAARADALFGAWLCGAVLGSVGMSLHHKICHTLGGSFDMPHAETHAVMLPHTIAYNFAAAPDALAPVAAIFGSPAGAGLHRFAVELGAPTTLKELGFAESDLDRAAHIATQNPYVNPRPIDRHSIREMLQRAWRGLPPQA